MPTYEESSSYSSDEFDNVSDGVSQIKMRPSKLKIVMKADKVKKKKKTTLEICLSSFRKVDFIRKANLIEYVSSESSSQISVDSKCFVKRDIKKGGYRP